MALIGHKNAFEQALRLLKPVRRRAIVLVAPEGVGRQFFARQLFLAINSDLGLNIYSEDLKVLPSSSISVEDIREIGSWVLLKPIRAHTKFLVVNGSGLSVSAQNALLKLLEETPSHLVIVLYVSSLSELLPATRSRLCPVTLTSMSQDDCEKVWYSLGVDAAVYPTLWKLASGHPGLAIQRSSKKFESFFNSFTSFLRSKNRSAITFLQWQNQLPSDWTPKDHYNFWLWVLPKIFSCQRSHVSLEATFCKLASGYLLKTPSLDTTLILPSLWFEVFGK